MIINLSIYWVKSNTQGAEGNGPTVSLFNLESNRYIRICCCLPEVLPWTGIAAAIIIIIIIIIVWHCEVSKESCSCSNLTILPNSNLT